jgi:hypothetical protein
MLGFAQTDQAAIPTEWSEAVRRLDLLDTTLLVGRMTEFFSAA